MSLATETHGSNDWTIVELTYDFELEPRLALAWVTELVARPLTGTSPAEYVALLSCYADLARACPDVPKERLPSQLPSRGRALLQQAMREASQRNPNWLQAAADSAYASQIAKLIADRLSEAWQRLPDEIWSAFFGLTNLPGTIAQVLTFLESLARSLPLSWIVRVQGGKWELYDANANARKHAFGKAAKGALKPRMVLRARGVRMPWKLPGAWVAKGAARIAAPGARTVAEGLKIAQTGAMRWISKAAYSALPLRGVLGSNAFGAILTIAPQLAYDINKSGVVGDPTDSKKWQDLAVREAKNQSANLFGLYGGMALGAGLVMVFGITAAPGIILIGLASGAVMQAGFNAFGLSDDVERFTKGLFE